MSCLLVATDKHEPNPYRMWLSQSLAPQNPKSKCNFASCSEAKAKPGRLSGEGRWQAELSDPQGPAQILSHGLMTSCHVSFYLCHPPLISLPISAPDSDWPFSSLLPKGAFPAQSSDLHGNRGQWLSFCIWSQVYRSRLHYTKPRSYCLMGATVRRASPSRDTCKQT